MLELAAEESGQTWVIETEEARSAGPSYSIDTVTRLQKQVPGEYFFVMGSEVFHSLPRWKSPRALLEKIQLALVVRPGEPAPNTEEVFSQIPGVVPPAVTLLPFSPPPYSSTQIRADLAAQGERAERPPAGLQRSVWQFIKENQIYTVV
jgi:nicotinate-nucleotide adenylyltransferase